MKDRRAVRIAILRLYLEAAMSSWHVPRHGAAHHQMNLFRTPAPGLFFLERELCLVG